MNNISMEKSFLGTMKFEWCLASFCLGICAYFAWPVEPASWGGFLVLAVFLIGFMSSNIRVRVNEIFLLLLFLVGGFERSILHTSLVGTPILPNFEKTYEVTGWVEDVNKSGPLQHFYIRVQSIKNLSAHETPHRIRVRLKPRGFVAGDAIWIRAMLSGPKDPVLAGGYDPARAAFFKKNGGSGFAISKPASVDLSPLSIFEISKRNLVRYRFALSRKIQARAPPKTAGLQAALLTGDRSAIPDAHKQSLRSSGLAHLLAISGLHMGLLAGGVYGLASMLFAMIGPLARRYDMRKYAAFLGIITAFSYLMLSGASVSTQRAFIMAVIVFAAVILNRRAVSLRSVALAAAITLILHPESLMSAGFQMSFAATTALVVVYRSWANKREYIKDRNMFQKIRSGFVGISFTSLIAGVATGGFAALHFHRFARLGLIANITAMPMFTFIVMPAGFMSVLLIPFGLDGYALKIMGLGLDYVLYIANWVAGLNAALLHIKSANGFIISLYGFGFIGLCLGVYSRKIQPIIISGILIGGAFGSWGKLERADIRVSDTGRIAFWDSRDVNILHVDRKRGDKFGRSRFVEAAGIKQADYEGYFDTTAMCDQLACRIKLKGKVISIVTEPEAIIDACVNSDVVILSNRNAGVRARRLCKSTLLDRKDLLADGARDIYITDNGVRIKSANPQSRKNRPWG